MSGAVATIYEDRYLVCFGGVSSVIRFHNLTFIFDFETQKWINYDKFLYDKISFEEFEKSQNQNVDITQNVESRFLQIVKPPPRFGHVGVGHGNSLLVFGGQVDNSESFNDLWILTLERDLVQDFRKFLESKFLSDF
ncbi:kelch repeat domain [Anaeramoeba ignava]|uniref:Kelch repeat domain n=1 Tax=Anaeramoeba ignava TaxID=1746090 RepID=A0A9Q0R3X2_ANAIG|nr:kelch repeat domain [Anaeramoeba ignava]